MKNTLLKDLKALALQGLKQGRKGGEKGRKKAVRGTAKGKAKAKARKFHFGLWNWGNFISASGK